MRMRNESHKKFLRFSSNLMKISTWSFAVTNKVETITRWFTWAQSTSWHPNICCHYCYCYGTKAPGLEPRTSHNPTDLFTIEWGISGNVGCARWRSTSFVSWLAGVVCHLFLFFSDWCTFRIVLLNM